MNCRTAQQLLSAERDGALTDNERAALDGHLAGCAACRHARSAVAGAIEHWRGSTATIRVPDPERAWHDVRRTLRTEASSRSNAERPAWSWALSLSAAAALAFSVTFAPRWLSRAPGAIIARTDVASAEFVEVPDDVASIVYVDDRSGWLVVWAVEAPHA